MSPDRARDARPAPGRRSWSGSAPEIREQADVVFSALADPTRRHLLERISEEGPLSATELASGMTISRQAVVKHLSALAAAGLLRSDRRGRQVLFTVESGSLHVATDWLEHIGRQWDERLVALVKHLSPREG